MDRANFGDNRWKIIYGKYDRVEKAAIDTLYGAVSQYTQYILTAESCDCIGQEELCNINPIFIGTKESNKYISLFAEKGIIELSGEKEGYFIKVTKSIFNQNKQMIIIAGDDCNGVLYGAVDFEGKYLADAVNTDDHMAYFKNPFCIDMPEYEKKILSIGKKSCDMDLGACYI